QGLNVQAKKANAKTEASEEGCASKERELCRPMVRKARCTASPFARAEGVPVGLRTNPPFPPHVFDRRGVRSSGSTRERRRRKISRGIGRSAAAGCFSCPDCCRGRAFYGHRRGARDSPENGAPPPPCFRGEERTKCGRGAEKLGAD